ncbi:MAG: WD40/YVTN/BNR-like repeat-containing protein [Terriglobales bacterium]
MRVVRVLATLICAVTLPTFAATPTSGTLTPPATGTQSSSVTWNGGPYTGATADPSVCTIFTCDSYALNVNVPATFYSSNPNYSIQVGINWASSTNDFDLYVHDSSGNVVCSSGQGNTNFELADCGQLASGTYTVQIVTFAAVAATYTGNASLGPEPANPVGKARYKSGSFTWTNPILLPGPQDAAFGTQDIEPRVRTDAVGNIYAAGIQGIPAGTDTWKSLDGGKSWTYLGEPDGAQAASAEARGGGLGGGDEDLAVGTSGLVYVNSLWLGSDTESTSFNGGNTWLVNPLSSDVPLVDRQWIASLGDKVLYFTTKQLGADLNGTASIFVNKSFDGGITWPQVTQVTTPELGVQPGDQGNIECDPTTGNVYTVFFGSTGHDLYIARSTDGGLNFTIKQVYSATPSTSLVNVFPSLAIDRSSNLYIVFSDSHNVLLTTSKDQGATWTVPVRVSNGTDTKSAIGPWITAGDAGRIDITWWGTTAASNNDPAAQWHVFFAQSVNALASIPTFAQTQATGVMHAGAICTNGTGCASGTRNLAEYFAPGLYLDGSEMIVYSDDYNNASPLAVFIRQTGGAKAYK